MLNPSTATEIQNDPTVERWEKSAYFKFWIFQGNQYLCVERYRSKKMKRAKDPVGLQNNKAILDGCRWRIVPLPPGAIMACIWKEETS